MSWTDFFILMYEYLFQLPKVKPIKAKPKPVEVLKIKRKHVSKSEFYDTINELLLISSHAYDLTLDKRLRNALLNVVEMCQEILQAQDIEEQSHILFTEFYHEKVHEVYVNTVQIHRKLVNNAVKNSLMTNLF